MDAWRDFWSRVYGFDGMFPRTIKDITRRPGHAALKYIQGNRVTYYGPVGYFFLMVTLFVLLLGTLGVDYTEFIKDTQQILPFQDQNQNNKFAESTLKVVLDNLKLVLFLAVPFQALAARFVFFRKSGYNWLENTVLPFYLAGHLLWLSIFIIFWRKLTGQWPANFAAMVSPIYFGFGYVTFFPTRAKFKTFLKGFGVYIVGQLFFILAVVVVVAVILIYLANFEPEIFNQFRPSAK